MYAGPLAESAVTASMCFSSTTTVRPTTSNIWQVRATCSAVACLPLQTAVMPAAIRHGVFGMARMTGTFGGRFLSIIDVGTDAATDMISCFGETCSLISRITSSTTCGFTPITMMSAPLAASTLLVPNFTFNFADNALARSSWATVAHVDFAESRPLFSNACRMIPPILPAPRNATLFPVRSFAMGTYDFPFLISQSHDREGRDQSISPTPCTTTMLFPTPCCAHDLVQATGGLPVQQRLRLGRIGHQCRGIPGTSRHRRVRNALAGKLFDCGNYLPD